jgi:site-specific DNA-methyltransferase (adenine-specific)
MLTITNENCMDLMSRYPDNHFDLAIVDPPYGINEDGGKYRGRKKDNYNRIVIHKKKKWDNKRPDKKYFNELFRITKNQIVWGANYFVDRLKPCMGWVFWDKKIGGDFSDGELAYTSFDRALKMVSISYHSGTHGGHHRIHPTQKPVTLYRWLLQNYAKAGDKILDTHMGSGSIAIACYYDGYDLTACEIDIDYYNAAMKRIKEETKQQELF